MTNQSLAPLFSLDPLATLMIGLVGFIGLTVAVFARRYLRGDAAARRFGVLFALVIASVMALVAAANLWVLLAAWGAANLFLVNLMIHKRGWLQAHQAGRLAARSFGLGFLLVGVAFILFYQVSGTSSIAAIIQTTEPSLQVSAALLLLLAGAMIQSGIWPFNRWLTSSLNSPTPVSAIMHAGLVNGGGILLARFAPLYFEAPILLNLIFVIGLATALIGTLFKLMQSDVKRMLASSTMGQMGFMFVQCGLGLFPAALAHLCWHGLFKANLFLASGSAAQEKRLDLDYPPSLTALILATVCGVTGGSAFALISGKSVFAGDTTAVLVLIAALAGTQFALPMVRRAPARRLPLALVLTTGVGAFYGLSVHGIETLLAPMNLMQPQPLNALHLVALALLATVWLAVTFGRNPAKTIRTPMLAAAYVRALNASQPDPSTVTTHRNHYSYL